jgi:hypothetical protein
MTLPLCAPSRFGTRRGFGHAHDFIDGIDLDSPRAAELGNAPRAAIFANVACEHTFA